MIPSTQNSVGIKDASFDKILNSSSLNLRLLRSLSWHGIPIKYRAKCWQLLLGYLPVDVNWRESHIAEKRNDYFIAVNQQSAAIEEARNSDDICTFRQVLLDVPRTKPEIKLFSDERVQGCLERILCIWTVGNQDLSYVQGINDLVTPFFSVFLSGYYEGESMLDEENIDKVPDSTLKEVEADTYWCLNIFLASIRDHYTMDLPGQNRMVNLLESRMQDIDQDLWRFLKLSGLEFNLFAFKWMNCLLVREFPFHCIIRMWDTYLSEENLNFEEIHVYVCAGFLEEFSSELQKMDFEDLFQFIQRLPTKAWRDAEVELLLSQASSWRLLHKEKKSTRGETPKRDTDLIYDTDTILFL